MRLGKYAFRVGSVAGLLAGLILLVSGCFKGSPPPPPPPAPPAQVGAVTTAPGSAVAPPTGKTVAGGKFNRVFPKDEAGYDVVFTQEKDGFAEADLKKNGAQVAKLSITDLTANKGAVQKYSGATKTISGYPMITQGNSMTSVLVGGRYQVKAMTLPGKPFTPAEREAWLGKFNLAGLAALK